MNRREHARLEHARRRKKRKHRVHEGKPLLKRASANQDCANHESAPQERTLDESALDFVHEAMECARAIQFLSVVDACQRECLGPELDLEADTVPPAGDADLGTDYRKTRSAGSGTGR